MVLIPGGHVEIKILYTYLGQECMTRCYYQMQGAAFLTADPLQVGEAYWENIKTVWRALMSTSSVVNTTDEVFVREVGGLEQYASFAVPSGERVGTRSAGDDGGWVPGFNVAAVKLTVGSSVTRPGQKRVSFLRNGDIVGNSLTTAQQTLVNNAAAIWSEGRTLGSPVATGILQAVVGGTVVDGDPTVFQSVVGRVVSPFVSSQVSRKRGHGS